VALDQDERQTFASPSQRATGRRRSCSPTASVVWRRFYFVQGPIESSGLLLCDCVVCLCVRCFPSLSLTDFRYLKKTHTHTPSRAWIFGRDSRQLPDIKRVKVSHHQKNSRNNVFLYTICTTQFCLAFSLHDGENISTVWFHSNYFSWATKWASGWGVYYFKWRSSESSRAPHLRSKEKENQKKSITKVNWG
jgi:hypothetical protein